MRISRITMVGIALIVLGITAFVYHGFALQGHAEDQNIWALTPILAAAMLLAAGILLVAAEVKNVWSKLGGES